MLDIQYCVGRAITPAQFIQLLQETTLGARRPVDDTSCIEGMLKHADILVTAWAGDNLVGVARSVTDFTYCCYLSDLAVSEQVQAQGIGKALIRHTFGALQKGCKIILLSAPQATEYYPKIGFNQHNSCWQIANESELK